jgi:hypothetical protein
LVLALRTNISAAKAHQTLAIVAWLSRLQSSTWLATSFRFSNVDGWRIRRRWRRRAREAVMALIVANHFLRNRTGDAAGGGLAR